MRYKSPTQPLCRCCGKPIAKWTTTQYFGGDGTSHHRMAAFPRTKEEAQRLVNQRIVSVRYHRHDPDSWGYIKQPGRPEHDYVDWASLWDGETYKDQYFCGDPCAVSFAYAHARAGHTCQGYFNAMAKQKENS